MAGKADVGERYGAIYYYFYNTLLPAKWLLANALCLERESYPKGKRLVFHSHQREVGLLPGVLVGDLAGELGGQGGAGARHRAGQLGELAQAACVGGKERSASIC